ncbi:MAG: hypothetical protein QOG83_3668, partial [Alphaproteobacteria bacterium]|nr:hypothetical protein [Alphaproteobacteria bacterium]
MKKTAVFTVTVVALASATSAAMADQRWVHKSSDAGTGANCGANSNVNDAVNGPCTTLTAAYNNAKAAGGNVARLMILSSGGFNESLTLDWGNGPSEIRSVGDSKPGLNGLAGQNSLVINTLSDVRLFDFRIGGQSGAGLNNIQAVGALGTLELHRMELRGAGGFGINIQPTSGNGPNSVSTVYIVDSNIANASQGLIQIRP